MLVFDRGKFISGVLTLVKLGVSLAILFVLGTKFLDMWQAEADNLPDVGLQQEIVE
ncbi:MAG: hypothetical protein AAFU71_05825 [Cyanobacteria bacterium J06632_22]